MRPEIMVIRTDLADGSNRTMRLHHAVDNLHATTDLSLDEIEEALVGGIVFEGAYYTLEGHPFEVLDHYMEALRRNKRQLARLKTHLAYYTLEA